MQAASLLRDPDAIVHTAAALARLYRAELRKDTFDAASSHPPAATDLQHPLHSLPGPQVSLFNATSSSLPTNAWAAIADNLHLWEALPGPLPLRYAALRRHLRHGRLDLSDAFPSSHLGPPVRDIIAALHPCLNLVTFTTPSITSFSAVLSPLDCPHALDTLFPYLASVTHVTLHANPETMAADRHLERFLAEFPGERLLSLHIFDLTRPACTHMSSGGACVDSVMIPAATTERPRQAAAAQPIGENGSGQVNGASPDESLEKLAAQGRLSASKSMDNGRRATPLECFRACLDQLASQVAGEEVGVQAEASPTQDVSSPAGLSAASPVADAGAPAVPPPPFPPQGTGAALDLPRECVLRPLCSAAVRPKLTALHSMSVPVTLNSSDDVRTFQTLPLAQLTLLDLTLHIPRRTCQASACAALTTALAGTSRIHSLAIRCDLQASAMQALVATLGTRTTLRSLMLRPHDAQLFAYAPDVLGALSTLSGLQRLACPPCPPLLTCMQQLTYLEWTGGCVKVPRDVRFTVPTLREFVLPCALPLHGKRGSLPSLLVSHPRLESVRFEAPCTGEGEQLQDDDDGTAAQSSGPHACTFRCRKARDSPAAHMLDVNAWGECTMRDDSMADELIPAVAAADAESPEGSSAGADDDGVWIELEPCSDPECACKRVAARAHACEMVGDEDEQVEKQGRASAVLPRGVGISAGLRTFGAAMPWIHELRLVVSEVKDDTVPWSNAGTSRSLVKAGMQLGFSALRRLDLRGVPHVMGCLKSLQTTTLPALSALRLSGHERDGADLLRVAEGCESWRALRELRLNVCVHRCNVGLLRKLRLHEQAEAEAGGDGGPDTSPLRMRKLERRVLQEVALRCLLVEHASVVICNCSMWPESVTRWASVSAGPALCSEAQE